jgi:hypothetical protein
VGLVTLIVGKGFVARLSGLLSGSKNIMPFDSEDVAFNFLRRESEVTDLVI